MQLDLFHWMGMDYSKNLSALLEYMPLKPVLGYTLHQVVCSRITKIKLIKLKIHVLKLVHILATMFDSLQLFVY